MLNEPSRLILDDEVELVLRHRVVVAVDRAVPPDPRPAELTSARSGPISDAAATAASAVVLARHVALDEETTDLVGDRRAPLLLEIGDHHAGAECGELAS